MCFQNRATVDGNPEKVVGFTDKTELTRSGGGTAATIMNDPVVGFDLVGDTKDFWGFGSLAHGHKDLGGSKFLWNGKIFS